MSRRSLPRFFMIGFVFLFIAIIPCIEGEASGTWSRRFGGPESDGAYSVMQTADGGYIVAGGTVSYGAGGNRDSWLIKVKANGSMDWHRPFGEEVTLDSAFSVAQTDDDGDGQKDDGYIVAGRTSTDSHGYGAWDAFLRKTDSEGNPEWDYNPPLYFQIFGGLMNDWAKSVAQTADGGYILAGYTCSYTTDGAEAEGADFWLIKTDEHGDTCDYSVGGECFESEYKWVKIFSGPGDDYAEFVEQTSDNGYIITGYTNSFGAGENDVWLIKTDEYGDTCDYMSGGGECDAAFPDKKMWVKTFGSPEGDFGHSVRQTDDGGYIVSGSRELISDAWLIKTDEYGDTCDYSVGGECDEVPPNPKKWVNKFGGSDNDSAESVAQTSDGGYIVAGSTSSYGAGSSDVWLIKTDEYGKTCDYETPEPPGECWIDENQWVRTYGGSESDGPRSVAQTGDGGYIVAGGTSSYDAGSSDALLIKTDENGEAPFPPTLVELVSFEAEAFDTEVILCWETASEIDNEGFHLWRAAGEEEEYIKITPTLIPSEGGPTWGASYEYIDRDVSGGHTYFYKLEDIDIYGVSTFYGPVEATVQTLCGVINRPTDRFGALWLLVLAIPAALVLVGRKKFTKERKGSGEKQNRLVAYEPPKILTYSGEELLEELGPAQACRGFTCPVSPTP